ncbi:MAG: phytoene/squalene synthase family protein [Bacteroidota bacterium]
MNQLGQVVRFDKTQFQHHALMGVSRTFALTIPQLPKALRFVVSNAYLLCRIVDTIEDEPTLSFEEKEAFCQRFIAVVAEGADPESFAKDLSCRLSQQTIPAEHQLVKDTAKVIEITRSLTKEQQDILERCLRIMVKGMLYYQKHRPTSGLGNLKELNRYCYYVAGVVGEMLTDLFCEYSPDVAHHHRNMMNLANSFGQGLQLTNILKDIWDDLQKGICWLPKDVFASHNFDLQDLKAGQNNKDFEKGLRRLVGITCRQLEKALHYTLLIPSRETGIRTFCFWNIGMAALTLRKINRNLGFASGDEVKISRNSVKFVAMASNLNIRYNQGLTMLFKLFSRGLPREDITLSHPLQKG